MPKVVATARGYYGGEIKEPGDEFDVTEAELKGAKVLDEKGKHAGEFRAPGWFKSAEEAEAKPAKKAKGKDSDKAADLV